MKKLVLNHRQISWMVAAHFLTTCLICMPQQLAWIATTDAWASLLVPGLYAILFTYVFYRLSDRYPGKTIFQITAHLAGPIFGNFLNAVILLNIWFIFTRDSQLFIGFVKTNLLPNTPEEFLLLLLMIILIYYGQTSIEVAARVNEIFFPLLCLLLLSLPVMLSNELRPEQLQPFLTRPPAQLAASNLIGSTWYGDVIVLGAFLNAIRNPRRLYFSFRFGILLSVFLLTLLLVTALTVLGPEILAKINFPSYMLVEQIHISDFLDRLEIFIFSIYFPAFLVSIIIAFVAMLVALSHFTNNPDYTFYSKPLGWFILLATFYAFSGVPEVTYFTNYGYPLFVFAVQPVLLVIFLLLLLRKKKARNETDKSEAAGMPEEAGRSEEQPGREAPSADGGGVPGLLPQHPALFSRWPVKLWKHSTHVLMAVGFLILAAGVVIGPRHQPLAILCSAVYWLCLLLLTVTSYMETKKAGSA